MMQLPNYFRLTYLIDKNDGLWSDWIEANVYSLHAN